MDPENQLLETVDSFNYLKISLISELLVQETFLRASPRVFPKLPL